MHFSVSVGPPFPPLLLPVHDGGHRLHLRPADHLLRGMAGHRPGKDRRKEGRGMLLGQPRAKMEAKQIQPEELHAGFLRGRREILIQTGYKGEIEFKMMKL